MDFLYNRLSDGFAISLTVLAFYVSGWGVFDNVWVSGLTVWLSFMVAFFTPFIIGLSGKAMTRCDETSGIRTRGSFDVVPSAFILFLNT